MRLALIIAGVIVALAAIGYLGLQVKPRTSPPPSAQAGDVSSVELPAGLPAPVDRFYRQTYGDEVPLFESAVVWGAPRIRLGKLWVRMRHVTVYTPGQHDRELAVPWFGLPVITGHEYHKDGRAAMDIAGQVTEGPQIDQAGCLGSWGEALMAMPAIYVTDPRVRWEAVDDQTARMTVPCGTGDETFTVAFDPDSGLVRHMTAMRYRGLEDHKTLWHLDVLEWGEVNGVPLPTYGTGRWDDERQPYIKWTVDGILFNADLGG